MDTNVCLVIELILFNGTVDFLELSSLLFINKEIYTSVSNYIQLHCSNYFEKKILTNNAFVDRISNKKIELCTSCLRRYTKRLNPFHLTPLCKKCSNKKLIHKTNAKQIYKLKDSDLARIPYHCYHISNYRLGYIYDLHTVQYISLLYKIQKYKNEYKNPPKPPKKEIRKTRVCEMIVEQGIQDEDEQYHILSCQPIFYYIQNGSYGIKKVKKTIQEWKEFYQFIHDDFHASEIIHDLNINEYFEKFIQDKESTIDLIHDKFNLIMIRRSREQLLKEALGEYDIITDYKCDAYFKFIVNPNEDLYTCIDTIREYHFFIVHTDYINIKKNKMDNMPMRRYMTPEQIEEIIDEIEYASKKMALYFVDDRDNIPEFIKLKYSRRT